MESACGSDSEVEEAHIFALAQLQPVPDLGSQT